MPNLTPAERRGALIVVLLLAIGAGRDLWSASHPVMAPPLGAGARRFARRADSTSMEAPGVASALSGVDRARGDSSAQDLLDLNRADARALDGLPGVGPVLAGRIVEQRRRHGPFRRLEDLRAIRGIGPRLLERIGPRVRVIPPEPR